MDHTNALKHRYFVALSVPDDLKQLYETLPRHHLEGLWHHKDDLHITIRFLGPLDADLLSDVQAKLREIKFRSFFAQILGLDAFYNKKQSIMYAKVESTRKLVSLCTDITDKLTPLGFDFGTRPYIPHVTFCRVKKNKSLSAYMKKHEKKVHAQWKVMNFELMRSIDKEDSALRYELIESYSLYNT
jgi:2'-5' RNA ligase